MLNQDYISLRLARIRGGEEWTHNRTGLTFIFPKGGAGRFISGALIRRLMPGDVLVVDGAVQGRLSVPPRGELVFRWFSVCCEHLFPLFANSEICLVEDVREGFKSSKLYPAASAIARESNRLLADVSPHFNLDHRSQLLRVVAAILATEFVNMHGRRVGFIRAEEHLNQVFEKLSVSEILGLSVGELANRFGCSRRHLNRLFHQHFGVSVGTLRMEMRLSKAVSLLRDPDAKIIRVAEECGFNHLGLFNTCFKKRFGVRPGQWRKGDVPAERRVTVLGGAPDCQMRASGLCPWSGNRTVPTARAEVTSQTSRHRPPHVLVTGLKIKEGNGEVAPGCLETPPAGRYSQMHFRWVYPS